MIDLTTAKAHLKVDVDAEDLLIESYLAAAQAAVQGATGKPFTAAAFTLALDGFPRGDRPIWLPKGPVSADATAPVVKYDDQDGIEQTLADFRLVQGAADRLAPAYGQCWPVTACGVGSVRVTYTAGYDGGDGVPAPLDQAVLLLVAHYYAEREAVVVTERSATVEELPLGVQALIAPYGVPGMA